MKYLCIIVLSAAQGPNNWTKHCLINQSLNSRRFYLWKINLLDIHDDGAYLNQYNMQVWEP